MEYDPHLDDRASTMTVLEALFVDRIDYVIRYLDRASLRECARMWFRSHRPRRIARRWLRNHRRASDPLRADKRGEIVSHEPGEIV